MEIQRNLTLEEFLLGNPISNITQVVKLKGRLSNYEFVIKPLTQETSDAINKACSKIDPKTRTVTVDMALMQNKIITECVVTPDFRNAEFLKKANFPNQPETFVKKFLLAGEAAELYRQIQILSGFETEMPDMVIEAKN